jgi:hypothetical protein
MLIKKFAAASGWALLIAVTSLAQARAEEPGSQQRLSHARLAVEQSSLSQNEKLGILTAADRAVSAGISPDDAAVIISRGLEQGAGADRTAEFLETAAKLGERKLPMRLVLDRIEQGLAKGVPSERIAAVARKLSAHLAEAKPLVEKMENRSLNAADKAHESAVEAVARALEKSIPAETIVRTGEKVREQKGSTALFGRAVDTMTTFVGNGMATDHASRLVHTAVDRGYSEPDLETMERYMVNELRKNSPMNDIVSGMESRIERGALRGSVDRHGGGGLRGPGSGGIGGGPGMGGRR